MYELSYADQVLTYNTRAEAIAAAKELSVEHHGGVTVQDEDQLERMVYQHGELMSYDYETRRR